MEWRFSWRGRTPVHGRTAVIQLADTKTILVVHISRMGGELGLGFVRGWVVVDAVCRPTSPHLPPPTPLPSLLTPLPPGVPPKLKALIESDRPKMGANIMSEWVVLWVSELMFALTFPYPFLTLKKQAAD